MIALCRHSIVHHHFPQIARCLQMLTEEEIWWRPNEASNSVGNLVLHLAGNVRQWIISSLGGQLDTRRRDLEFAERGPLPRRILLTHLRRTVSEADRVLATLTPRLLSSKHEIQGFRVSGLEAVTHVMEHLAFHAGQIVYVTKMKVRKDLGFTRLPRAKTPKVRVKSAP